MTVIGLDDTDSREAGMCTTYVAARLAAALEDAGAAVERTLLVRLNPAVEHKTRGNAALAVHTDADPLLAFDRATELVGRAAEVDDPNTQPGLVVAPGDPDGVPSAVSDFAREAVREHRTLSEACSRADRAGYRTRGWAGGRGRIGALAAVGAWSAFGEWTAERIAYRERERWGTPRTVDADSVFAASDSEYPAVWDTADRGTGEVVCVPHTPCPVLYGIRGDDPDAVARVADAIESEPVARSREFLTNQGTDAHLRDPTGALREDGAYLVDGTVTSAPETREGGHVFVGFDPELRGQEEIHCAAFEPTKRFRDVVRALRPGDRITACGEFSRGTLKLEKLAVRELVREERRTPDCPECGRRMESAGADQGYRCRECDTTAPGKATVPVDRDLEIGWYEVPPRARRHVAKPLVRGGFDAPTHAER